MTDRFEENGERKYEHPDGAKSENSITERLLYLTTIRCMECGNGTTYAHEGDVVAIDQDAPWPGDVYLCPECGTYYPDDLAGCYRRSARNRPLVACERR